MLKILKEVESKLALKRKAIGGKGGFKDVPNSAHLTKCYNLFIGDLPNNYKGEN